MGEKGTELEQLAFMWPNQPLISGGGDGRSHVDIYTRYAKYTHYIEKCWTSFWSPVSLDESSRRNSTSFVNGIGFCVFSVFSQTGKHTQY